MAANGISTLATKELRQIAKLDLAATTRAADGNPRATYDITQLPTQYNDNAIVDNPNTDGLVLGRPWVSVINPVTENLQLSLSPTDYSGTGTSWTDSSGNDHVVTIVGAPAYNTEYFTFDGSVEYFDTNQSFGYEEFTVGVWFRTTAGGIKMLVSKETAVGNPWNYRIWLNGGQLVADMSQVTTQASLTSPLTTYNDGEWYNVTFTRTDSVWYLYVNGVEVNTRLDPYTGSVVNSQELWIGRSAFTAGYQYIGDIGDSYIYNRALSSAEVLQNFNALKGIYGL